MEIKYLIFLFFCFWTFSLFCIRVFLNKYQLYTKKDHHIHEKKISKVGFFAAYFILFYFILFDIYNPLILFSLIFLIPTTVEDLFSVISPKIRLTTVLIASYLFLIFSDLNLPIINLPILEFITENSILSKFFYSICLLALANGFNMLDGVNGLLLSSIIIICLCCMSLHTHIFEASLILLIISLIVFFFNYPKPLFFCGDAFSYFIGWILGLIVIDFYGSPVSFHLPNWGAILLFFFPLFEVIFTTLRRLFSKYNVTAPDNYHLHSLIFVFFKIKGFSPLVANNLVLLTYLPLFLINYLLYLSSYNEAYLVIFSVLLLASMYLSLYYFVYFLIKRVCLPNEI
jgi:UDP-N-acetylmuramyl pentapeptide phosphotransferase/UDP-N-acetylglucosamine-1-phosphate transferase